MPLQLEDSVQYLKGVGEKRAQLYHKLGIQTVKDLLMHYPTGYIDLSHPCTIQQAPLYETCAVAATVVSKGREQRIRRGLTLIKVTVTDQAVDMVITFFNMKYSVDALRVGESYIFYGTVAGSLLRKEMRAPQIFRRDDAPSFSPVYPLTAGLSSKMIGVNVSQALSLLGEAIPEPFSPALRQMLSHEFHLSLCQKSFALQAIHFPDSDHSLALARQRLIFEELFFLSLGLAMVRGSNRREQGIAMESRPLEPFYQALPFKLTEAQLRVIRECTSDMTRSEPMNRLVQGDVGSGKTMVAAAAVYFASQNGCQSAIMAPTEILAEQHYKTLRGVLEPLGLRVALLTGSTTQKQKRLLLQELEAGEIDLVAGTHALLEDDIRFCRLGLIVTDEQHRFGVAQRLKLTQKGDNPHTMVMSATPIPRTLAYVLYGDLDISVIDQMPANRLAVESYLIDSQKRERAYGFIKKFLDQGRQAYIVCPLIEHTEGEETPLSSELTAATEYARELSRNHFAGYRVGLLHGRMKPAEKEAVMQEFKDGKLDLLVATTVVEVGVDVPNAVVMMIENAERFGLSQLHQLRGRVGRGSWQSYCILVSDNRNPETRQRLKVITSTSDGFRIAEEDLKLRGPGDFFGYRQHGLPMLKLADMLTDVQLLNIAQQAAQRLIALDPRLEQPENRLLRQAAQQMLSVAGS